MKLESLLTHYKLTPPSCKYYRIEFENQSYYECMIEIPELFIQESSIAKDHTTARENAAKSLLSRIAELKLLPAYKVA